jgi:hypothetical protein
MCHRANEATAWQCTKCSYEFGQDVDKLRTLLRDQLKSAWIVFSLLAVLDLAVIAAVVWGISNGHPVMPGILDALMLYWTYRVWTKISISRHSLRLIDEKQAPLPKATAKRI